MASGVAQRLSLHSVPWNANGAGSLQREAYYRRKCGNSHGKLDHRTNAHATALDNQRRKLNFTVSITLLAAEQSSFLNL